MRETVELRCINKNRSKEEWRDANKEGPPMKREYKTDEGDLGQVILQVA